MARDKTAVDFVASIEVIESNLELFHRGTRPAYRPVATELRKLMCDGAASLLPRVFDDIRLHKLWTTERYERMPERLRQATYFSCSTLLVTPTATRATLDLAQSGARLPLDEWLRQPFMSPSISIGEFVRSVADKEGAHAAPRPNATLAFTGSIHYGGGNADLSHAHEIPALAEYIAGFVRAEDLRLRPGVGLVRKQVGDRWQVEVRMTDYEPLGYALEIERFAFEPEFMAVASDSCNAVAWLFRQIKGGEPSFRVCIPRATVATLGLGRALDREEVKCSMLMAIKDELAALIFAARRPGTTSTEIRLASPHPVTVSLENLREGLRMAAAPTMP